MANCIRCGRTLPALTFGKRICTWCKRHEAAQRGEDPSEYQPVMPAPWARNESLSDVVTLGIFGINVAVFIGMLLAGASPANPASGLLLNWGCNYGPYTITGDWWRLLTSCFVHIGIVHLAINMWCLWSLGGLAEHLYGRTTFACIYLLCGIGGSLGSIYWHHTPTISAGASGALFGITGALIASLKLGDFSFGALSQSTLQSLIVFVGYSVAFGIFNKCTDNACHAGGFITGLVLGALVAKAAPMPRFAPRAVVLLIVAVLLSVATYAVYRSRAYPFYLMRADARASEGKLDAAVPLYQKALTMRPQSAAFVHYELGQAYLEQKDLAAAERELRQALAAAPSDEDIAYDLGMVQLELQHYSDAQATYSQMLTRNPLSVEARVGLGMVASRQGDCTAAQKHYDEAERLNPRLNYIHYRKGSCWLELKRYDDAIAAFRKEIEVNGDDAATERSLAQAYKAKGMIAESEAARLQSEKLARERSSRE